MKLLAVVTPLYIYHRAVGWIPDIYSECVGPEGVIISLYRWGVCLVGTVHICRPRGESFVTFMNKLVMKSYLDSKYIILFVGQIGIYPGYIKYNSTYFSCI